LHKLIRNKTLLLFIIIFQEAFTAVIPFFLLSATINLISNFMGYFDVEIWFFTKQNINFLSLALQSLTSVISVISISYFAAIRFKTSEIISITLALSIFTTVVLIENTTIPIEMPCGFTFTTLLIPFASIYFLKLFYPMFNLRILRDDGNFHIYRLFNYLFVFLFAYLAIVFLYIASDHIMDIVIKNHNPLETDLPDLVTLSIRNLLVEIFWFFGMHGEHTINALFGQAILYKEMYPNFTYAEFNRIFVVIGGAGIGLGLLISVLFLVKEKALKTIARISIPLAIFNINTLLIYATVVLNRFLFIPFVILPFLNLIIASIALKYISVDFSQFYIFWNTPIFVDSYLKTGGNLYIISLQICLILFNTLTYIYFTKKFIHSKNIPTTLEILEKNLDITDEIKSKEAVYAFEAHKKLINAQEKLDKVIKTLNKDNLKIYYQPKIDTKNHSCTKLEALIRHHNNGKITGPTFLNIIEDAGLAPVIDVWVCKEVKKDLQQWKKEDFFPQISINLHPDNLKSKDTISNIINILKGENVIFEIIERSFLFGEIARENLQTLQENGFKISIDDFGVGYSSLEILLQYDIDELKIDKSIINVIDTKKGFSVCKYIATLSKDMGCLVTAEGVEKKEQVQKIKQIDIDYIQGFYFSHAIPFDDVKQFCSQESFTNFKAF